MKYTKKVPYLKEGDKIEISKKVVSEVIEKVHGFVKSIEQEIHKKENPFDLL